MREFIVGLVFFVLVGLLLGVTLWVSDPSSLFGGEDHRLTVRFDDVGGLERGNPVWVLGAVAGRVDSVEPDAEGTVIVGLSLDDDPRLKTDAEISLRSRSALGGMVVSIRPGSRDAGPWTGGDVIQGKAVPDALDGLSQLVDNVRGPITDAANGFRDIVEDFRSRSETIADNIDKAAENARIITDDVRGGKGTLGKLISEDGIHKDLEEAAAQIRKLTADTEGGPLDTLMHDKQMAADLKEGIESLKSVGSKLDSGTGTLARLLNDEELYDSLSATARNLESTTGEIREGRGLLGRLVYDEELADRFDRISKDVAQLTRKLRDGEGTLGRLIQDDELYADLRESLKALTGGAEDARENAPILTFAGVLFSGL